MKKNANTQMDFSNYLSNNKRGFYPKCLTAPFVAFVVIVIVLFFVAIMLCRGGVADCCKNSLQSTQIEQKQDSKQNNNSSKDTEKIRDDKVGTTTSLGHSKPKESWQIAQERFLQYNSIDENYKLKESLFFDKNSSFLGKGKHDNFTINLQNIGEAKLAIIFGYGCDLGGEEYNIYLIDKRINRVADMIKQQYPNMQILTSNEGRAKSVADDEKTREFERRVDIYFY